MGSKLSIGFVSTPNQVDSDARVIGSTFWQVFSGSLLGFNWQFRGGYFGVASTLQNSIVAKSKYVFDERIEIGANLKVEKYDFGGADFSLSVCLLPDPKEQRPSMLNLHEAASIPTPRSVRR
jgi:hypothetical protein